jgi:NAD(P)-dependent dehydrogenase (short-subunit alcohol dehydrogenase family)
VKGFTEALIEDLRTNAPQVRVALVMPGHIGTDIIANSRRAQGLPEPPEMTRAQLEELLSPSARAGLVRAGWLPADATTEDLQRVLARIEAEFRDSGLSAAEAATAILDGVRSGAWRILVGKDARALDTAIRAQPEAAYDYKTLFGAIAQRTRDAAG